MTDISKQNKKNCIMRSSMVILN